LLKVDAGEEAPMKGAINDEVEEDNIKWYVKEEGEQGCGYEGCELKWQVSDPEILRELETWYTRAARGSIDCVVGGPIEGFGNVSVYHDGQGRVYRDLGWRLSSSSGDGVPKNLLLRREKGAAMSLKQ